MSKSIGDKLDKLIIAVDDLTTRLDNLEEKYSKRLDLLQTNFYDRFKNIEKILTETAKRRDIEDIELKAELGTRYFKSNNDIGTDTSPKKYLRYR